MLESLSDEEQERLLKSALKPKQQHWGQWVVKAIFLPFTAPADILQIIADIAQGRNDED